MTSGPTTSTKPAPGKGSQFMTGVRDLFLVILLVVAAAGGGYIYGTHERFAPVEYVTATTPGAVKPVAPGDKAAQSSSPATENATGAPAPTN